MIYALNNFALSALNMGLFFTVDSPAAFFCLFVSGFCAALAVAILIDQYA